MLLIEDFQDLDSERFIIFDLPHSVVNAGTVNIRITFVQEEVNS
jgi:hypothetical protein